MKKRLLAALCTAVLVLGLAACGSSGGSSSGGGSTEGTSGGDAAAKQKTFAVVFPIVHPFFEPIGEDAEAYGAQNGWKVITKAPDSYNAQQQIDIVENLISMGVDGIAVGPTDSDAVAKAIEKALE